MIWLSSTPSCIDKIWQRLTTFSRTSTPTTRNKRRIILTPFFFQGGCFFFDVLFTCFLFLLFGAVGLLQFNLLEEIITWQLEIFAWPLTFTIYHTDVFRMTKQIYGSHSLNLSSDFPESSSTMDDDVFFKNLLCHCFVNKWPST